ncbi:MAG: alpha/beta hydrolase [Gammaproteobacteria bacterium]|nr:alpha/beta hydrolase [Gammaproteobacteria bacterium]
MFRIIQSKKANILFITLLYIFSFGLHAGEVYTSFPDKIEPDAKYVFYSHGYIVEGDNPKPVHPKFGVYDFPAIKEKLADKSYHLIAYHRAANSKAEESVKRLMSDVNRLMAAGVKPENITLTGFSKGGAITIQTSSVLKNDNLNFVIMAGCFKGLEKQQDLKFYGRVYSIYETTDNVGSCQFIADRSDEKSFSELAITTGKSHGAFYLPIDEWTVPLKSWMKDHYN